ncbi:hypothetical protein P3S67_004215 [Capsicum chacoense]
MELIPDEKILTNMKKKSTETFKEYAIRWREQAARVKPSMKESKIVETVRIMTFVTLKATTQAIQKGLKSVRGKKYEKDASAIVVGQQARERGPHHRYPQAQTQAYAQDPQNHSQNPLYSIPPPPYLVYNAQTYVQSPSYPQWRAPTPQSHPQNPQTYQSPSRPEFWSKLNNEMRQKSRDRFTPIGESYASLF